jgi:hypothetical protein
VALPIAESVAQQAVSTMRQWIETPSLQNIILVGGGAFLQEGRQGSLPSTGSTR